MTPSLPDADAPVPPVEEIEDGRRISAVTTALGTSIYFDPDDARGQSLAEHDGAPYPQSLALWGLALGLRDDWDVVLDIGANYGEMLAGTHLPQATRCLAFEPNPRVLPYLRRTVASLPSEIELIERAIGERTLANAVLDVDKEWSGTSTLLRTPDAPLPPNHEAIPVEQTCLDDLFPVAPRAICMKIDVEGYELDVLRGAAAVFDSAQYVVAMLEILHLPVQDVLDLSRRHPLYLLDIARGCLVRYTGRDGYELGRALHAGDLYRQDALILAGRDVADFDEGLRRLCDDTLSRDRSAAARNRALSSDLETLRRELDDLRRQLDERDEALGRLRGLLGATGTALRSMSQELRRKPEGHEPA